MKITALPIRLVVALLDDCSPLVKEAKMEERRKRISITGANGLIGSEIVRSLSVHHDVMRVNERLPNTELIIKEIEESDVFINNAMHKWGQVDLLMSLYSHWRLSEKYIINIGSRAAASNVSRGFEYSTVKNAINHYCDLIKFKDEDKVCKLTTINPGLVGKIKGFSLMPSYIGGLVSWLVSQSSDVEISRIDLGHIAPYATVQAMKEQGAIKIKD